MIRIKIFFETLPLKDINELFLDELIKKLDGKNFKKEVNEDYYLLICETEKNNLEEILLNTINNFSWSIKINWKNLVSSRPIRRVEIFKNEEEIIHNLPYNDYKIEKENKIIEIKVNSFLNEEFLKFIAKEKMVQFKDGNFIFNVDKKTNKIQLERVLEVTIKEYEKKFLKDIDIIKNKFFLIKEKQLSHEIHKKIGNYKYKIEFMKKISEDLKMNYKNIDFFQIGNFTNIGIDYPELGNFMTNYILDFFQLPKENFKILDVIFNVIHFSKFYKPTGKKDPFGLKKAFKMILDFFLEKKIYYPLGEGKDYLNILFNKKFPEFQDIPIEKKIFLTKNNLSLIKRIKNLLNKTNFNEHIELDSYEKKLLETLNFDILENYLNNYKISPYIERKEILEKFLAFYLK